MMMLEIPLNVCGDHWLNPDQLYQQLHLSNSPDKIILDVGTEGASLQALGIEQMVLDYCNQHNFDPTNVIIKNWPNAVENTPFTRAIANPDQVSHFFWLCKRYWVNPPPFFPEAQRFAFFMGRKTLARGAMMYDLYHTWPQDFLLSVMHNHAPAPWTVAPTGVFLEQADEWITDTRIFKDWWNNCPITSLDNHAVRDQYDPTQNTNVDLLRYYTDFYFELVAESYTCGDTFFPTEKTVRPLMTQRPMLIYGPKNFLSRLQKMGFRTWGELWDESYDLLSGPARWQAIKHTIQYIIDLDQDAFNQLVKQAHSIAVYNRRVLSDVIEKYQPL